VLFVGELSYAEADVDFSYCSMKRLPIGEWLDEIGFSETEKECTVLFCRGIGATTKYQYFMGS